MTDRPYRRDPRRVFAAMLAAAAMFAQFLPQAGGDAAPATWRSGRRAQRMQAMWLEFQHEQAAQAAGKLPATVRSGQLARR